MENRHIYGTVGNRFEHGPSDDLPWNSWENKKWVVGWKGEKRENNFIKKKWPSVLLQSAPM
jgi:hypothetical protein